MLTTPTLGITGVARMVLGRTRGQSISRKTRPRRGRKTRQEGHCHEEVAKTAFATNTRGWQPTCSNPLRQAAAEQRLRGTVAQRKVDKLDFEQRLSATKSSAQATEHCATIEPTSAKAVRITVAWEDECETMVSKNRFAALASQNALPNGNDEASTGNAPEQPVVDTKAAQVAPTTTSESLLRAHACDMPVNEEEGNETQTSTTEFASITRESGFGPDETATECAQLASVDRPLSTLAPAKKRKADQRRGKRQSKREDA